jgi:maleylpyruvate isomerase
MTSDPMGLSEDVQSATERLLTTAHGLTDATSPSLLPGWSRGHVLTHIARNADGAVNLLTWARTGVVTPQYASWDARVADIEAGAPRPIKEQVDDLTEACARFAEAVAQMPPEAWARTVRGTTGPDLPAALVMWSRLREVEIHHVDLGAGYGPADWPDAFSVRLARWLATGFAARPDAPSMLLRAPELGELPFGEGATTPVVSGPTWAIVGWLTGRTDGRGLVTDPPDSLPSVPEWS